MKRLIGWVLAGFAIGTAVRAAAKPAPSEARPAVPVPTIAMATTGLGATRSATANTGATPWRTIGLGVKDRIKAHAVSMMAGSLAYYAMLAVFPALIATVSIYGLVQDPVDVQRQIDQLSDVLPASAADIIQSQLTEIVGSSSTGLGIGATVAIIGALWAASGGTKSLISGINRAYDRTESRKFVQLRLLALGLTLGIIVFVVAAFSLATFAPALLENAGLGRTGRILVEWLRWPAIFIAVVAGLGVFYKLAPNRPARQQRLISAGALIAAALWVVATVGFSIYAGNLANFNQTYGTLAGVIVLLLWFYLSGLIVLVGAEINAEQERLTIAQPSSSAG